MSYIFIIKIIQSTLSVVLGVLALFYRKELVESIYGKLLRRTPRDWESKWLRRYYELTLILFGIGALGFALFNITGPINNW